MQRTKLTAHPTLSEQLLLQSRSGISTGLTKLSPAIINAPWAGWQYEVPADEDTAYSDGFEAVHEKAGRTDRVIAEFRVKSAGEAVTRVSEAVALAELEAYAEQARGVLVTRHDFDLFTVSLSSMVPFGVTVERDSVPGPRPVG